MDSNNFKGTIAVCTPMYDDYAHRTYINSVLLLADALRGEGYSMNLITLGHDGSTAKAKNIAINIASQSESLAGVLFLDANVAVSPQDILSMIESKKDVVGALVPRKVMNWEQVKNAIVMNKTNVEDYSGNFDISLVNDQEVSISYNECIPVRDVNSDLMYISNSALEVLKPKCNTFNHSYSEKDSGPQKVVEYFKTSIDENSGEFLLEDRAFCELWRSTGEEVWAAPWVQAVKYGDYAFSGSFLHSLDLLSDIKSLTKSLDQSS